MSRGQFAVEGPPIIPKHLRHSRPRWHYPKWRAIEVMVQVRDGHTCQGCGWRNPFSFPHEKNRQMVMDHIVPLARGGTNDISNLQLLCETCNSRKGARLQHAGRT